MSTTAPLRIAAHNGGREWGGAEIALCRLLMGLTERGHQCVLFFNREAVGRRAREEFGLEARPLHLGGDVAFHHAFHLARELRAFAPDVFVVGTFKKLWLATLAGRWARVPRVVARIGLSSDTPTTGKYRFVLRRWVDWIVLNDSELRSAYLEGLPGFPPERLVTVHKGIRPPEPPASPGALRRELGIPADAPVVGTLARLVDQKRLDRLVRVVGELPDDVHCLIAGEGPERGLLEGVARSVGVADRVRFLGFRSDVGAVLDALDVLVLTSERESLANAMLEALASGVPVVTTPVSGAAEALEPLPDGRRPGLVVPEAVEPLARAVESILQCPSVRTEMGAAARQRARERFGEARMLDEWERVLRGEEPG